MPDRALIEQLIQFTLAGQTERALLRFYADHVVVQENCLPPRCGLEANLARSRQAAQWTRTVHEISAPRVVIEGDHVVIEWHAEWTLTNGTRVRIEELALQRWEGGKIVFERFFYDPAAVVDAGFAVE